MVAGLRSETHVLGVPAHEVHLDQASASVQNVVNVPDFQFFSCSGLWFVLQTEGGVLADEEVGGAGAVRVSGSGRPKYF